MSRSGLLDFFGILVGFQKNIFVYIQDLHTIVVDFTVLLWIMVVLDGI